MPEFKATLSEIRNYMMFLNRFEGERFDSICLNYIFTIDKYNGKEFRIDGVSSANKVRHIKDAKKNIVDEKIKKRMLKFRF